MLSTNGIQIARRHCPVIEQSREEPGIGLRCGPQYPGRREFVPNSHGLTVLADAAHRCRGCELYQDADQAVFGAGAKSAQIMFVGEQPGDQEDPAGQPFVGPAGRLLDNAMVAAGIERRCVYVTNAVKHFKFTRAEREVESCRPWLIAELTTVRPELVVLLGATAAKSLMGSDFRLTAHRGEALRLPADDEAIELDIDPQVIATVHPS